MTDPITRENLLAQDSLDVTPSVPAKVEDLPICKYEGGPPVFQYLASLPDTGDPIGVYQVAVQDAPENDGDLFYALPLSKDSQYDLGANYSTHLTSSLWSRVLAKKGDGRSLKYNVDMGQLPDKSVKMKACRSEQPDKAGGYEVFLYERNTVLENPCAGKMMVKTDPLLWGHDGIDIMKLVYGAHLASEQYCLETTSGKTVGEQDKHQLYLKPDYALREQIFDFLKSDTILKPATRKAFEEGVDKALNAEWWTYWATRIGAVAGVIGIVSGAIALVSLKLMMDMNKVAKAQAEIILETTGKGKKRGSILAKGENLTEKARRGEIEDVVGVKEENDIREAKAAMEKGNNASALFDGERGDGKSATQDAIALRAARGDWGPEWEKVEFIRLNKRTLIGDGEFDMKMFGELEAMSKQLFDEVIQRYKEGRPVVLVLDETHWLVLLMDKPDILVGDWKEEMAERARFRILGGSTPNPDELPRAKKANSAFFDRFHIIERKPKTKEDIVQILAAKAAKLTQKTGVSVPSDLFDDIAEISFRREGRHSPRKAIGLMEMLMIRKAQANQGARGISLERGDVYREIDKAAEIELAKTAQARFSSESAHALLRERYMEEIRIVLDRIPGSDRWSQQGRQLVEATIIEGWMSQSDVRESYERTGKGIAGFTSDMISRMTPDFKRALRTAGPTPPQPAGGGVSRPDREVVAKELAKKVTTFAGWSPIAQAELVDQLVEIWTTNADVQQRYLPFGDQAIPRFVSDLVGRIPAETLREYRGTATRGAILPQRLRERAMEEAVVFGLASRAEGFGDMNGETQGQIIADALVKAESEGLFIKADRASLRSDLDKCMVLVDQVVTERKAADINAVRLREEKETERRRKKEIPAIFI